MSQLQYSTQLNKAKSEVLILGNPLDHEGGMVEFNKGLIKSLNRVQINYVLRYANIGSRMNLFYRPFTKKILYPFYYILDILRISIKLFNKKVKIVQVNPSLIPIPLIRDSLIVFIAKVIFRKKIVLVLHGWKDNVYISIERNIFYRWFLCKVFSKCDTIYVLANDFKKKLVCLGVDNNRIKITSTFFLGEDIKAIPIISNSKSTISFIYLGRISKLKGIGDLINTLIEYNKYNPNFNCTLIGHPDSPGVISEYKELVEKNDLGGKINFVGRITGERKYLSLSRADVFLFPSYTEGCPTAVIEALAVGLFAITTDVGALKEIINGDNGLLVKPGDVPGFLDAMIKSTVRLDSIRINRSKISSDAFRKYEVHCVASSFLDAYSRLTIQTSIL